MILVNHEVPVGVVDGVNKVFTVAEDPMIDGTIVFFENGLADHGMAIESIAGRTITLVKAPKAGTELACYYDHEAAL